MSMSRLEGADPTRPDIMKTDSVFVPKAEDRGWVQWALNFKNRNDEKVAGVTYGQSLDGNWRPPEWVAEKNVDIAGRVINPNERGEEFYLNKYKKEWEIADARQRQKDAKMAATSESSGIRYSFLSWYHNRESAAEEKEELRAEQEEIRQESILEVYQRRKMTTEEAAKSASKWETLVSSLHDDQPFLWKMRGMRESYDCYGIDEFVSSPFALLNMSLKVGCACGFVHGAIRALKVGSVDALYMHATGLSIATFINASVIISAIKWSANMGGCSLMFSLGDRLVTEVKKRGGFYPEGAPIQRTPLNYSVGMGFGLTAISVMPIYVLQDRTLAMRTAVSSLFVGGACGYLVGHLLHYTIALNLSSLDYTPGQFRTYQALVKREKQRSEAVKARLRGETLEAVPRLRHENA